MPITLNEWELNFWSKVLPNLAGRSDILKPSYYKYMENYSIAVIKEAVEKINTTCKKFPKVAEVLPICDEIAKRFVGNVKATKPLPTLTDYTLPKSVENHYTLNEMIEEAERAGYHANVAKLFYFGLAGKGLAMQLTKTRGAKRTWRGVCNELAGGTEEA